MIKSYNHNDVGVRTLSSDNSVKQLYGVNMSPARVRRILMGIEGLDEMLGGGVPEGHIIVLKAPTGGGKTTTALQFAQSCLNQGLSVTFISSNLPPEYLLEMSAGFGWEFGDSFERGLLKFELLPPITTEIEPLQRSMYRDGVSDGKYGIEVISKSFEDLITLIQNTKTKVVILDSLSEFLLLIDDKIKRRGYVLHIYNLLKSKKCSALINLEREVPSEEAEILADGIIHFERIQSPKRIHHVASIHKMRLIDHSKDIKEYKITEEGVKIFSKYSVI